LFTIVCTASVQYVPYEPPEHTNRKDRAAGKGHHPSSVLPVYI